MGCHSGKAAFLLDMFAELAGARYKMVVRQAQQQNITGAATLADVWHCAIIDTVKCIAAHHHTAMIPHRAALHDLQNRCIILQGDTAR